MPQLLIDAIGVAAGLCSMASFVPQVVKLLRRRDAEGVSLRMYAVAIAGFSLWTLYGVMLRSAPLVLANGVCLSLCATILALKVRLDRAPPPQG